MPDNYASLVWSITPEAAKKLVSIPREVFTALVNAAFRLSHVDLKYLLTVASPEGISEEILWRETLLKEDEIMLPPRIVAVEESSRAAFPLRLNHVDAYTAPRIALVGDAAHSVHPLAGQGLNLGLADAQSLRTVIRDSVCLGQDIGSSFPQH
jgi:ubiquinone biosynthesis monooxygenase Coq6